MNSAEGLFGALRNGTKFDTRRFAKDIQLFQRNASQVGGSSKALVSAPLPLIHFGETTEETGLPETGKKRSRDRLTRRPGEAGVRPSRGKKTKAFGESQTEGDEADGEEEMAVIGSISRKRNAGGDTKATRKERRKVRQRSLSAAQASGLAGTRDEENNRFRKELQIKVSGGLAPPPIRRFEELRAGGACSPWLLRKVKQRPSLVLLRDRRLTESHSFRSMTRDMRLLQPFRARRFQPCCKEGSCWLVPQQDQERPWLLYSPC